MARRLAAAAVVLAAASMCMCGQAVGSVGSSLPHLGPIPIGKTPRARGFAVPKGFQATTGMTYHGGQVMRANTTHAIYWAGNGSDPFPANYQDLINGFLANVAADSGTRNNVYSTDIQYYDTDGNIRYQSTFAGGTVDPTPYPIVGNCAPRPVIRNGQTVTFNVCLTDDQLANELDSFIAANGLPRGTGNLYLLYLPPGVQTCDDIASTTCFGTDYCAYHSGFFQSNTNSQVTLFANLPYANLAGCRAGSYPNDQNADPTIDATSHEHNETITDPLGDAWYMDNPPPDGGENGDLCDTSYGPSVGPTGFNQTIGSGHYFIQGEWSNLDNGCAFGLAKYAPKPVIRVSATRLPTGRSVSFDGSKSSDPLGSIVSFHWNFGDGKTGNGKTTSHAYETPGVRIAKLIVTDTDGLTTSARVTITATNRAPIAVIRLPRAVVAGRGAKFHGGRSHDPDGHVVAYRWHFGDHTRSVTGRSPGHTFKHRGVYRVRLTVTDDHGRKSTATATVTVAHR